MSTMLKRLSSKRVRAVAVSALAVPALVLSLGTDVAHAQSTPPATTFIDVDPATGGIGRGLVIPAGPGNYVNVPVVSRAPAPFLALPTTGSGYGVGDLVVPGGGFVSVPILSFNGNLNQTIRVWDAKTVNQVLWPDQLGTAANLAVNATSKNVTKPMGQFVLDQLFAVKPTNVTRTIRVFDHRTDPTIIVAPDVLGDARNLIQPVVSDGIEKPLALWVYQQIGLAPGMPLPVIPRVVPAPTPAAAAQPIPITPAPLSPAAAPTPVRVTPVGPGITFSVGPNGQVVAKKCGKIRKRTIVRGSRRTVQFVCIR